jgi:mRNA interferase RelE/StbE
MAWQKKEISEVFLIKTAEKTFDKSKPDMQKRLTRALNELEQNPLHGPKIRPLTGQLKGLYRYRAGEWRVIYRLFKDNKTVKVLAILPCRNTY